MILARGPWFKDEQGRTLLLRGVNLGGSSKVPRTPDGATYRPERFFDHREVSFVGRPFPLDEADEHFSRLRRWGFTFLRFLVTWEAIEHAGPGVYDQAYLDYVVAVVRKAKEHGLSLFIDPHQDVWSRFCGGDGAPAWTLEAAGLDITKFHATGAAIVHQVHGDPFPRMIWPTNASKLAAATMFTLFFGGNQFAPKTRVDGEPIQEYMQRHYIASIRELAGRLTGQPHMVGYGTLNEPLPGFIGIHDLNQLQGPMRLGLCPSPLQAMLLGDGIPQQVEEWDVWFYQPRRRCKRWVNESGVRAWLPGRECIWRQNGVWGLGPHGEPIILRPDHFCQVNGREVDFARDFYRPFANRFARAVRSVHPEALVLIEAEARHPPPAWGPEDAAHVVFAPHWYDGLVLFMKTYSPFLAVDFHTDNLVFGRGQIRRSFTEQLAKFKQVALDRLGGVPVLIGEFGVPFDLKGKRAYRTGDFRQQVLVLDRSFRALEDNLLSAMLWNYTADNTNARGDQWNDEDLSIFSRDQQADPEDPDSGGRALQGAVRPYAMAVAGEPLQMSFDLRSGVFQFAFRHDPLVSAPSEFFVPKLQYPSGFEARLSDGTSARGADPQILQYRHQADRDVHTVTITRKP